MVKKVSKRLLSLLMALCLVVSLVATALPAMAVDGITISNPYASVDWNTYGQYKADFHSHSVESDGGNQPAAMIEDHYAKGFDIMALTDHNVTNTTWDRTDRPVEKTYLTSERLSEIDTGTDRAGRGMIGIPNSNEQSISPHLNTFWTNFNNASGATLESNIAMCESLGGISHINHPGRYTGGSNTANDGVTGAAASSNSTTVAYYVDLFTKYQSCVGMEIINKKDGDSYSDRILWDNILKQTMPGNPVWGFSNDDTHSTSATGFSYNMMLLPSNTLENIRYSMENGTFYAVAKVAYRELGSSFVSTGETPAITNIVVDEAANSITVTGSNYNTIEWVANGVVIATGDMIDLNDYEASISKYVRAQLKGNGGIAFTQPFGVTGIDNVLLGTVTLTSSRNALASDATSAQMSVTGKDTTGADMNLDGATVSYSTDQGSYMTVAADGTATLTNVPAADVMAHVTATVTVGANAVMSNTVTLTLLAGTVGAHSDVLNVPISSGSDDVEEYVSNGQMYMTSSDLEITTEGADQQVIGLRFADVQLPANVTITKAYIQFSVDEMVNSSSFDVSITADATADSQAFTTTNYSVSGRTKLANPVVWSGETPWTTEHELKQTSDLKSLVQQLVDMSGWGTGNAMSFFMSGTGTRIAEAFEGAGTHTEQIPTLHIEYTTAATGNQEQQAPTGLAGIAPTTSANNDGQITGTSTEMEYKPSAGSTWTACGMAITGLIPGSYDVRLAAKTGFNASPATTVIVPTLLKVAIGSELDDMEERPDKSIDWDSSDLEITFEKTSNQEIGLRFAGLQIPKGATITYAYIQFSVDEIGSSNINPFAVDIFTHNSANSTAFENKNGTVSERPKSSNSILWNNVPDWTVLDATGTDQRTPNLSPLIQEIVNKSDWNKGNAISFILTGSSTSKRVADSYEGANGATQIPTLYVTYTFEGQLDQPTPTGLAGVMPTSNANNDGQITGTNTEMEFKLSAATSWTACIGGSVTGLVPGTYNVRVTAKPGYNASPALDVIVPAFTDQQEAPTGVSGFPQSAENLKDGRITGVTSAMEFKKSFDTIWTKVPEGATQLTDLIAGIYTVRFAAKDATSASPAVNVVVSAVTKVAMTIVDDHAAQNATNAKGFTWYTVAASDTRSDLQVVKKTSGTPDFSGTGVQTFTGTVSAPATMESTESKAQEYLHKALATGLEAGTTYCFRVGDTGLNMWSQAGMFTTSSGGAFTFIDLADPQAKELDEALLAAGTYRAAVTTVPNASFIVTNGDLVDTGSKEYQWDWLFNNMSDVMLNYTFAPIAGNHESQTNSFNNHFNLTPAPGSATTSGVYYSFDYSNAHFVMLNNNESSATYSDFSVAQVDWMKADIAAAKAEGKWIIVVMHKGPYTTSNHATDSDIMDTTDPITGVRNLIAPIFADLGVDLVLQGHDHIYARSKPIDVAGTADSAPVITEIFNGQNVQYQVEPDGSIYLIPSTAGPKVYYKNINPALGEAYYSLFAVADESHSAVYGSDPADSSRPLRSMVDNFESISIDGNTLTVISYEIDHGGLIKPTETPYIIDTFGIVKDDGQVKAARDALVAKMETGKYTHASVSAAQIVVDIANAAIADRTVVEKEAALLTAIAGASDGLVLINQAKLDVARNTILSGNNRSIVFSVTVEQLQDVDVMEGFIKMSDANFEITQIKSLYTGSNIIYTKNLDFYHDGTTGYFSLAKIGGFDDMAKMDVIEITITLKGDVTLNPEEENSLEAALDSITMYIGNSEHYTAVEVYSAVVGDGTALTHLWLPSLVKGDISGDKKLTGMDLAIAITFFDKSSTDMGDNWYTSGAWMLDFNKVGDGNSIIDINDLTILAKLIANQNN